MSSTIPISPDSSHRIVLRDELIRLYGDGGSTRGGLLRRFRLAWKLHTWAFIVGTTKALKRILDVVISACALVALLPLFAVVALLIKAYDGGPVIFRQKRVGRWGREFEFPKFRSMRVDAEALKEKLLVQNHHGSSVTFKMKNDPRITPIGRVIRKLSIDELPQLWCVLRGDMSLVGPRPPVPREVALYTLADRRRLDAVPGLTCIWQISGRGDIPFDRQVELDVQYIQSRSFWMDLLIILKTVPAVLSGRGAY
ncbi:MAG: sugar transferase [Isosphaeraceae bacterium]|nr:sugar transferase [Isosphaeraceae bacterium]